MATKVPFTDLSRIHAPLKKEILNRIESVIDRSAFVLGPEVEQFEKEFAEFRSEEHTSELQSRFDLSSFPTRRSSDLHSPPYTTGPQRTFPFTLNYGYQSPFYRPVPDSRPSQEGNIESNRKRH